MILEVGKVAKNNNFLQKIVEDRRIIMTAGMIAAMEVLKSDFNFTPDQLNKFAEKYTPALRKNLKVKE